mgnify:CR=1 FL=1
MKKLSAFVMIFLLSIVNLFAQQWVPFGTLPGSGITALKTNQNGDLFVATASYNYPSGQNAGVYRSLSGSGALINVTPGGPSAYNARAIETEGSSLVWASCWQNPSIDQEALYRSTDNGNSWTRTYQIGTSNNIFSIKADPDNDNVYIGARNGVHKSSNTGLGFVSSNLGMESGSWTYDIEKANGMLFAATAKGLYRSQNLGDSWTEVTGIPQQDTPKSIAVIPTLTGEIIVAGTEEGDLYISDETLSQFELIFGFENSDIIAMLVLAGAQPSDFHFVVSAFPMNFDNVGNGLYYSRGSGSSFTDFGQGLPSPYRISSIGGSIQGNNITTFAGSFNNTQNGAVVFKKNYTVGINTISSEVPGSYALYQNYPNPFNPSTNIKFQVLRSSHIEIAVYNSSGMEISRLVNESLSAGVYETQFDGSAIPSGVYFVRMLVDGIADASLSKKMILTK